jgi:hypothetical protein
MTMVQLESLTKERGVFPLHGKNTDINIRI